MNIQPDVRKLMAELPLTLESPHFKFHFGLRNPLAGTGLGVNGVRTKLVVVTYMEALEALHQVMTSGPWNRELPPTDATGKTHVYILDDSPFTTYDRDHNPYIVLSCRSNEPTTQAELHRAAAEAVHEGTHLFNYKKRPMYELNSEAWVWFDEGLAMLMEMLVSPGNPDYFRFLTNWIDMPEMSLDDPDAHYVSGMFVRYLSKKMGCAFVNDVWMKSEEQETPLETLERLMPEGQRFISANPDEEDLFASGYCIDPYFIWDHGHPGVAPDVFLRYGERAISESRFLKAKANSEIEGFLDHLACRYYRFFLKSDVRSLDVEFNPLESARETPFKAEIVAITKEREREKRFLLRASENGDGASQKLSVSLSDLDPDVLDHLVLVVSNCGMRSQLQGRRPHDDKKEYRIVASAT